MVTELLRSWNSPADDSELDEILRFVEEKNSSLEVKIDRVSLPECSGWYYDEAAGELRNSGRTFFQIMGLRRNGTDEQPVLMQKEIGCLGIICQMRDGVMKLLMQAKIEPGNVNKIQISPTVQATKSNFTQKHGGRKPPYIDYFLQCDKHTVILDQIQSEQSSRFLGKRNRNMMIMVNEEIEALPGFIWMTLGTLKRLMKIDNLVNMDTRTVISCIPYSLLPMSEEERSEAREMFSDKALFESMFSPPDRELFTKIYTAVNNRKMFGENAAELVPLKELSTWEFRDNEIVCRHDSPFKVIFCDIKIEGREVTHWCQPLFAAAGPAVFGLISCVREGKRLFLVHVLEEAGCFDTAELAPSVQLETNASKEKYDAVSEYFFEHLDKGCKKLADVMLSEEGGRFYHEQNRNIIIDVGDGRDVPMCEDYFWADFSTLDHMIQYNNVLNIQLRNLISLLEM